jgi:hypothetical protein
VKCHYSLSGSNKFIDVHPSARLVGLPPTNVKYTYVTSSYFYIHFPPRYSAGKCEWVLYVVTMFSSTLIPSQNRYIGTGVRETLAEVMESRLRKIDGL